MARHLAPATPRCVDICFVTVSYTVPEGKSLPTVLFFRLGLAIPAAETGFSSPLGLSCFAPFRLVMKAGKSVFSLRLHMVEMISSHFGDAAVERTNVETIWITCTVRTSSRVLHIREEHVISYQFSLLLPSSQPRMQVSAHHDEENPRVALSADQISPRFCKALHNFSAKQEPGKQAVEMLSQSHHATFFFHPAKLRRRVLEQRLTWRDCRSFVEMHRWTSCYVCVAGRPSVWA